MDKVQNLDKVQTRSMVIYRKNDFLQTLLETDTGKQVEQTKDLGINYSEGTRQISPETQEKREPKALVAQNGGNDCLIKTQDIAQ